MQRKMDLLEQAHGLLCNAPGAGGAEHDHEAWLKLRAEWIERWSHVIKDQQTKRHNVRIAIGNAAITASEEAHRGEHVPADWDSKRDGGGPTVLAAAHHRADAHQERADHLAIALMRTCDQITKAIDADRLIENGGLASSPETGDQA
jgi:hypothetical protein